MPNHKNVFIIAGPNGSGKTTFAKEFLPNYAHCPNFINADLIAQGLAPFSPRQVAIKAGKLVLQQIKEFAQRNVDFGFETTLAGKTYLRHFKELKEKGYRLHLFFLWIPSSQLAIARIRDRVAEGGHDVPSEDVKRRFERSIVNFFNIYRPLLDTWLLFDNSEKEPKLIAKKENSHVDVRNDILFQKILNKAGVKL
jgi:predicted ABC-type ATPase